MRKIPVRDSVKRSGIYTRKHTRSLPEKFTESKETTVQEKVNTLASKLSNYFTTKKRPDGTEFTILKDDAPQFLIDAIHKAHGDMLPDDYKYKYFAEALNFITENDTRGELSELASEFADQTDIYNHELLKWVSSNLNRVEYVNEAVKEFGIENKDFDVMKAIAQGQYQERYEVFSDVLDFLTEQVEE